MPGIFDPQTQGLLQAAFAGLQASGPSRMPVSFGQVLGQAGSAGLNAYDAAQKQEQALAIQALDTKLKQAQLEKANFELGLQRDVFGGQGGILAGMDNPALLRAVGLRMAAANHPGAVGFLTAADRLEAGKNADAEYKALKSTTQTIQPDPQEAEQTADQGTPAVGPATVSQGGIFSTLSGSPYVGTEAKSLQGILDASTGGKPEDWVKHYERLRTAHNAAQTAEQTRIDRELNLPKSEHVVQDKASPTGWSYEDTRTMRRTPGAPPPPSTSAASLGDVIPPQHKDLHGDDYLSTLPTGMALQVKAIAAGELDPSKSASLRYGNREALMQRVLQYDPTYTQGRTKAFQAFTDPNSKIGGNIRSLNMSISHLGTFAELAEAMNNGNMQRANQLKNALARELGKPEVNNIQLTQQAVGEELMRVFREVNASEHEAKQFADRLSPNLSPAQFSGAVQTAAKLLTGRLDAINGSWKRSANTDADFPKLIDAKTATVLQKMGVSLGGSAGTPSGSGWTAEKEQRFQELKRKQSGAQ